MSFKLETLSGIFSEKITKIFLLQTALKSFNMKCRDHWNKAWEVPSMWCYWQRGGVYLLFIVGLPEQHSTSVYVFRSRPRSVEETRSYKCWSYKKSSATTRGATLKNRSHTRAPNLTAANAAATNMRAINVGIKNTKATNSMASSTGTTRKESTYRS